MGGLRLAALVLFIAAVNLLIRSIKPAELTYAIVWLLHPLRWFQFPVDRFAVRLALTLDYVSQLHLLLQQDSNPVADVTVEYPQSLKLRASRFIELAANRAGFLYGQVIQQAERNPQVSVQRPSKVRPGNNQWLLPISLLLLYRLLGWAYPA